MSTMKSLLILFLLALNGVAPAQAPAQTTAPGRWPKKQAKVWLRSSRGSSGQLHPGHGDQ